jgi:serine/threonine protein kinase
MNLLLGDRFRAIKIIGQGGFGKTFLAVAETDEKKAPCVIKQFLPIAANNTLKAAELFQREARQLEKLGDHPQIPHLRQALEQNNRQYLIQEYIPGKNLAEELQEEGLFEQTKILNLLHTLLPVLQFLEQNKVIHRDIKSQNIIRNSNSKILFLVDFGSSKTAENSALLKTGTIIGSAEYTAPEQIRGKAVFASDIYSLGVTCIHLLTGVSPFELIDFNNQWNWRDFLQANQIDDYLGHIIDKMIEPRLSERYQSATAVLNDLEQKTVSTKGQKITLASLLAGLFLALISLIAVLGLRQEATPPPTPRRQPPPPTPPRGGTPTTPETPETLEKQALEGLILLAGIENDFYLENGKFLGKSRYLPYAKGHTFITQKISENAVQIVALAQLDNLRSFLVVMWGGEKSTSNLEKVKNYKPQDTDFGTLALPSLKKSNSPYMTRLNYCESQNPSKELPSLSNVSQSVPVSYEELKCPDGYMYSFSIIKIIGEYSAKTLPVIISPVKNK